jgi:hypothetical protein
MWEERKSFERWTEIFDSMHAGTGPNAWSYQLTYASWTQNWLNIVPGRNLVQNIGFGEDATHTKRADVGLKISPQRLNFPITHPPATFDWPEYAIAYEHRFNFPSLTRRVRTKFEAILNRAS